jgi:hypothetical protein
MQLEFHRGLPGRGRRPGCRSLRIMIDGMRFNDYRHRIGLNGSAPTLPPTLDTLRRLHVAHLGRRGRQSLYVHTPRLGVPAHADDSAKPPHGADRVPRRGARALSRRSRRSGACRTRAVAAPRARAVRGGTAIRPVCMRRVCGAGLTPGVWSVPGITDAALERKAAKAAKKHCLSLRPLRPLRSIVTFAVGDRPTARSPRPRAWLCSVLGLEINLVLQRVPRNEPSIIADEHRCDVVRHAERRRV